MSPRPADAAEARRAAILEAAIAELAARGFEAASTNAIAAAAGVAKGLVFHYFGSKEGLFLAAYRAVVERTTAAITGGDDLPADLFERLHAISVRKLRAFHTDPAAWQLLASALAEAPASLRGELAAINAELLAAHGPRTLAGIDASRLRPGISVAQAFETITLVAEGFERRISARFAALPDRGAGQLDAAAAELWSHLVRLRDGLYAPAPGPTPARAVTPSGGTRRSRRTPGG